MAVTYAALCRLSVTFKLPGVCGVCRVPAVATVAAVTRQLSDARKPSVVSRQETTTLSQTKHLGPGSECPALQPGTLRLYSMRFCPYAERTMLVLAAKDIPHEVVNVNLKQKPDWYLAKYPLGKVPALELDAEFVPDSLITCDLLDELYPEPALYPADPWRRACDRFLAHRFNACGATMHRMYRAAGDNDKVRELSDTFNEIIQVFEAELVRRDTSFFFGSRPGMLDLMIWPWMERFPAARKLGLTALSEGHMPPPPSIKTLDEWVVRMYQDPIVKKCLISTENHMKFLSSWKSGAPDYDMEGV